MAPGVTKQPDDAQAANSIAGSSSHLVDLVKALKSELDAAQKDQEVCPLSCIYMIDVHKIKRYDYYHICT